MYFTLNYLFKLNKLTLLINIGVILVLIGSNTFLYYFQVNQQNTIFEEKIVVFEEENIGATPMTPQYEIGYYDAIISNTTSNVVPGDFANELKNRIKQAYQDHRSMELQPKISIAGASYSDEVTPFIVTDQSLTNDSDRDFGVPVEYLFFDDDTFEALFKLYNLDVTELSDDSFVYIRQGSDIFSKSSRFNDETDQPEKLYGRDFNPISTASQGAVTIGYRNENLVQNYNDRENNITTPYNGTYISAQNITIDPNYVLDLETLLLNTTQSDDQIVALQGTKASLYTLQSENLERDTGLLVSDEEESIRQKNLIVGRLSTINKAITPYTTHVITLQIGISFTDIPIDDYETLREINAALWPSNDRWDFQRSVENSLQYSSLGVMTSQPEYGYYFYSSSLQPESVIVSAVEDVSYLSEFIYFANVGVYLVLLTMVSLSQVVISRSKLKVIQILKDRGYTTFSLFIRGLAGSVLYTGLGTIIGLLLSFGFLFAVLRDYNEIVSYIQSTAFSVIIPLLTLTVIVQIVIDWQYIRRKDRKTN